MPPELSRGIHPAIHDFCGCTVSRGDILPCKDIEHLRFIERGENYPTQENNFKLAAVLDMSLDEYIFSYTRFNDTFCISEINESLSKLSNEDKELIINIVKTTCETLKKRKTESK